MQISLRTIRSFVHLTVFGVIAAALPQSVHAQAVTVSTVVNFDGTNGDSPYTALTLARDGNFYGTTNGNPDSRTALGTVFKLTPGGALTTLVNFSDPNSNSRPNALVQGNDGNFYGTSHGVYSSGFIFSVTSSGTLTTLHAFGGSLGRDANGNNIPDGSTPNAGLIQARDGNFYGTTSSNGGGYGAIFAVNSGGAYAQPAVFVATNDGNGAYGRNPEAALLQGSDGNFYGTTPIGGTGGLGTVVKYIPGSGLSVLASFSGPNGAQPHAELIQGTDGNFYGTTARGGSSPDSYNSGTVFRLTPAGQLTTLVNFNGTNGNTPQAALLQARDGNFYGTTSGGGAGNFGTIFKMTPAGALTTLYSFPADATASKGAYPYAALIQGPNGDFYGTTILGGSGGHGTVFRVNVSPNTVQEKTLGNIATRLQVGTGDNALIGGFIVTGPGTKKVIVRGIGPSLTQFGIQGALANPTLELRDGSGQLLASNDNWKDTQQAAIQATGIPPTNDLESAIVADLPAANARYTAILRGKDNTTGVGVVEAYDLDESVDSRLGNISTRGFVDVDERVMIAGIIVGPTTKVGVRAIGPSLSNFEITNPLQNPSIDMRDINGAQIAFNDNWKDTQRADIEASGLAPSDDRESALIQTLAAGNYTVTIRGIGNTTGIAVVEAYNLR
ncbi:MAG: hypothetical protein M3Z64_02365 [Verrucomicrobiota bacterium]|nr:hypothetical protein [Verrucomicrobiota bacterium]